MNKLIVLSLLLSACFYQYPDTDAASDTQAVDGATADASSTTPDASPEAAVASDSGPEAAVADAAPEAAVDATPDADPGVCTGCFEGDVCSHAPQTYEHCGFNDSCVGCLPRITDTQCQVGSCVTGLCNLRNRPNYQRCNAGPGGTLRGVCTQGACLACGGPGQPCCTDGTLDDYLSCDGANECDTRDTVYDVNPGGWANPNYHTCQHCGGLNEQCCTGFSPCAGSSTNIACLANTCSHCGGPGQTRCP